ncbi:MAG TPA: hypothetical protein VF223_25820 [Trebonia sp.]
MISVKKWLDRNWLPPGGAARLGPVGADIALVTARPGRETAS